MFKKNWWPLEAEVYVTPYQTWVRSLPPRCLKLNHITTVTLYLYGYVLKYFVVVGCINALLPCMQPKLLNTNQYLFFEVDIFFYKFLRPRVKKFYIFFLTVLRYDFQTSAARGECHLNPP